MSRQSIESLPDGFAATGESSVALASGASLNDPEMLVNMDPIKEARQLCEAMDGYLNII